MMVYGAILEKGEHSYTYLKEVFQAIGGAQKNYNWLISDADCFPTTPEFSKLLGQKSCWLTGEALTAMVEQEDFRAFFPLSEDLIQKIEALNDQAERKAGTLLC